MKRLLFISHESSRTGAPLVLLYFLKWLKGNYKDIHISLVTLEGGNLLEDFKLVADEFYDLNLLQPKVNFLQRNLRRILLKVRVLDRIKSPREKLVKILAAKEFDLIYANTVISIPLAHEIKTIGRKKSKLVVHVHELEGEIKRTIQSIQRYNSEIDVFIAASGMVEKNLSLKENISIKKIKVIYSFTKFFKKKEYSFNEDNFIVGGAGKYGHRKGSDLFIQTARYLNTNFPDHLISFIWVGNIPEYEKNQVQTELQKLNFNTIQFIGEVENPEEYFKTFDIFYLSSREDPFPLVCIEAGTIGMPIICFDECTGISEIVKDKGGYIAPYLNIESVAEKIIEYKINPEIHRKHTLYNQNVFKGFTVDEKAPEIFELLEELLKTTVKPI